MDAIQKYAGDLDPGIGQCLLTQSAAASPSRILQSHPQVWIHAAQPSGVSRRRHTTARPALVRAKLLLPPTAYIIQTSTHPVGCANFGRVRIPVSAACAVLGVYYLPPSDACSRHKLLASWRRRAHSVPPDHPKRKNEEIPSRTARARHPVTVML
jgi:hypothetical protein